MWTKKIKAFASIVVCINEKMTCCQFVINQLKSAKQKHHNSYCEDLFFVRFDELPFLQQLFFVGDLPEQRNQYGQNFCSSYQ